MQMGLRRARVVIGTKGGTWLRHGSAGTQKRTAQSEHSTLDCGKKQCSSVPTYTMYSNRRRWQSFGLTAVAVGQAGFWASASNLSFQISDPILGTPWTLLGFTLSGVFGVMVTAYLRRMVDKVQLLNGPVVRVTPHSIAGMLGYPVDIPAAEIVPSPHRDDPKQRHWTFGVKTASGRTFYYILDMKVGVVDRDGLAAIVKGGDHFMAWSHKRDAEIMRNRWQQWRKSQQLKV